MQVKDALQMYEGIVESTFKFIHCWYMLRNEMKWNEWLASMSASNGEPSTEPATANADATLPPRIDRPNGRDRAKKPRTSSTASSACLEVLQKMSMDRNAYEERVEAATKEEAKDIASLSLIANSLYRKSICKSRKPRCRYRESYSNCRRKIGRNGS